MCQPFLFFFIGSYSIYLRTYRSSHPHCTHSCSTLGVYYTSAILFIIIVIFVLYLTLFFIIFYFLKSYVTGPWDWTWFTVSACLRGSCVSPRTLNFMTPRNTTSRWIIHLNQENPFWIIFSREYWRLSTAYLFWVYLE